MMTSAPFAFARAEWVDAEQGDVRAPHFVQKINERLEELLKRMDQ